MPAFLVIVAIACIAVLVFGFSTSMIGYGLLKTTAKFGASSAPSGVGATGWTFQYSKNMPEQMWAANDGTFYFDFPTRDGVHYVVKKAPRISFGQTVTMNFAVNGAGELQVSDTNDIKPATIRLYMQGPGINDRWWGHPAMDLTDGDHAISIRIDDTWTGVGGGVTQLPLKDIIGSIANVGFTFGGQSFAGHGIYANGSKRFTLKSYTIS